MSMHSFGNCHNFRVGDNPGTVQKKIKSTRRTELSFKRVKRKMSHRALSLSLISFGLLLPLLGYSQSNVAESQSDRAQVLIGTSASSPTVIAIPAETSWTGSISLNSREPKGKEATNLQAWLDARRNEDGLSSATLKPWHIVIDFDQFDEDGDNVHSGTLEEFWGGPQRSKIGFKSDQLSQTDFITGRGLFRAGDQRWQNRNESEVRLLVLDPFANGATLHGFRVAPLERKFGDHTLHCDGFQRISDGFNSPNQYCYDMKDSALRYVRGPGWWQITYNDIVSFQDRFVARDVVVTDGGHVLLKLRVTKLERLDQIDDNEFSPTADAVNLSGTRVTGVPMTPLRTVPIDISAVGGLPKFEVLVQIVIGKDGKVIEAKAISGPKEAYKAAEAAARKWEYLPFIVAGQPEEVEAKITFSKF